MHILMLTQFFAPVVGGIERHVLTLSQQLVARGHCVSVATLWQDGLAEAESLQGIQVHRLKATTHLLPRGVFADGGRVYPPPLPDPRIMVGLQELVATGRPDIIHAHNWFIYSYLPLKALHRLPVVETLHDYHLRCPKWTMIQGDHECSGPQLAKCLGCSARHFGAFKGVATVLSSRASGLLEERGVDKFFAVSRSVALKSGLTVGRAPYMCIPNFVRDEVAQITDDVAAFEASLPDRPFILFVGALGRHKGLDVLLEGYRRLERDIPLVLIGYPVAETDELLRELPAGTEVLLNWPNQAVIAAMKRSLCLTLPSVCPDACPTVIIEALACGAPVVATRVGGIPDMVVPGENGLLCAPGDPESLARALEQMVDDTSLRARACERAPATARPFLASRVIETIEREYQNALRTRQAITV